jgi:hypothetical protein
MPRKKTGPKTRSAGAKKDLAEKLAAELKSSRDYGQPVIDEHAFAAVQGIVAILGDKAAGSIFGGVSSSSVWNGIPRKPG